MQHEDRVITRRLVHEHRALSPLVAALRKSCSSGDSSSTNYCLASLIGVLLVGDLEAADDARGINPYIEPIDWLGAFELVDPLRTHADATLAGAASTMFAYFIPNDME
jgi:hypothetical protein